jgi:hypothetical protein
MMMLVMSRLPAGKSHPPDICIMKTTQNAAHFNYFILNDHLHDGKANTR